MSFKEYVLIAQRNNVKIFGYLVYDDQNDEFRKYTYKFYFMIFVICAFVLIHKLNSISKVNDFNLEKAEINLLK